MDNDYEDDVESINEDQEDQEDESYQESNNNTRIQGKIAKVIKNNADDDEEDDDAVDDDDDEDDEIELADEEDIEAEDEDDIFDENEQGADENKTKQNANIRPSFNGLDDISDDEDDEDDDYDENYLQKFDEKTQQNIISEYHPELQTHNYNEVEILSRVVRDGDGNIIDPLHQTLPFITRYEKAKILGERAKQINAGAPIFVEVDPSVIDGYLIALKEFEEKKIPFIIKRPLPNGGCEYWKFKDLELL
jgi:DNA-directed RNA polymerase I, II, and III subunit RPABC2